jgi:alginate O-acetyltransferase complex protein AlgI
MDLIHIVAFIVSAIVYTVVLPARWRGWALMLISVMALYWLQPTLNLRWMDYTLPTLTLVLAMLGWWLTRPRDSVPTREDGIAAGWVILLALVMTVSRYMDVPLMLTSRPPPVDYVLMGMGVMAVLAVAIRMTPQTIALNIALLAWVVLFIIMKTEPLTTALSGFLRGVIGQDVRLASPLDLGWLGFSYVAFRLIHTLRDRQTGKLPAMSLRQYLTFIIFFPAVTAGPIDRAERHLKDDEALAEMPRYDADRIGRGLKRISIGLFKKFVIADSLAVFSLSALTAEQATSTAGLWLLVYAYAFRLFFDFSGYTDIAIGIGLLFGVQLPENFNAPYLKQSIAAFWQSWHITLSNWVRFYVYMPLSRMLLRRKWRQSVIIFCATLATMLMIGLWHGVTVPFFIWGVWHGSGLFIHKLWSDNTRKWYRELKHTPRLEQAWKIAGIFLTFHFVVLGWVWFALPSAEMALTVLGRLFGL